MRLALVALLLLSGTSGAALSGTDAVSLRKGGEVIALPGPVQKAIADQVRELTGTCNFNSVRHARLFEGRDARAEWREVASRSHLHVRYRVPFPVPTESTIATNSNHLPGPRGDRGPGGWSRIGSTAFLLAG